MGLYFLICFTVKEVDPKTLSHNKVNNDQFTTPGGYVFIFSTYLITTIVMFMLTINVIPPSKVVDYNPFLKQGEKLPMVAAHRGGATTNPQNTMKAFKSAVNEYQVDIIESDLYLTSDGYLIFNHDDYIDEKLETMVLQFESVGVDINKIIDEYKEFKSNITNTEFDIVDCADKEFEKSEDNFYLLKK